jgi:tetratricopeptide (TPR) repeat protein
MSYNTRLLVIAVPVLCGNLATAQSAQDRVSLRWITTLDRALPTSQAFHHSLMGVQQELVFHLSLGNFEGGTVYGIDRIPSNILVNVNRDGKSVSITEQVAFTKPAPSLLVTGDEVEILITIRPNSDPSFTFGDYTIRLDLSGVFRELQREDGSPWVGRAKMEETRHLEIRPVSTMADRAAFLGVEGNFWLGKHDAGRALPYLDELVRLKPEDWRANAAVGAAYLRLRRYSDAAVFLERSLPGWLRLTERRGDLVPNELASAYLVLGREAEAIRVLRAAGLTATQIPERLRVLRAIFR